jgi:glucosamine-6-phosphate isomerase
MKIKIFDTPEKLGMHTANQIIQLVIQKPNAVLCLATGHSPVLTYEHLVEEVKKRNVDFSSVHFVGLDEWVGVKATNPGSCHYFLHHYLFEPLKTKPTNIHLFNGLAKPIEQQCSIMNETIKQLGGIDLMLVGIGINGHIGFNEPGTDDTQLSHVTSLDKVTIQVSRKYFPDDTQLEKGITLGIQCVLDSKCAILIANGTAKSEIIKQTIDDPVSMEVPASMLRKHDNSYIYIDKEAGSKLNR